MSRQFIIGSVIFHAVLLAIVFLLPPPFPSVKEDRNNLSYVEVQRVWPKHGHRRRGRPGRPKPDTGTSGITFSSKAPVKMSARRKNPAAEQAGDEEDMTREKSRQAHAAPAAPRTAPAPPAPTAAPAPPAAIKPAAPVRQAQAAPSQAPPAAPSASKAVPSPPPAPARPAAASEKADAEPSPVPPAPAQPAPVPQEKPDTSLAVARARPTGLKADRNLISFKSLKGWPVPSMVRVRLGVKDAGEGVTIPWRAQCDSKWVILSRGSGRAPAAVKVGVDTSKLSLGYYEAKVRFSPPDEGVTSDEISVSVMVLPREKGAAELPHYSWDEYMNGNCKVCHLPENLMPSYDFMLQPEFCMLCHNPSGMAKDRIPGAGGHPMLVAAGTGGTKMPTHGTVPSGERSDRMAGHFKAGKLIVCVTCHNVMAKPGDYGRAWEMTSSKDRTTYYLARGGWENMGYIEPKVYVTDTLMKMPRRLKDLDKYLAGQKDYSYDEAEGSVTFTRPLDKGRLVYVTLTEPYLRVSTENSRLCYDCHFENTHAGLNCLACHKAHGTPNRMGIRDIVRTPDGAERRVTFKGRQGRYSFADGGSSDGICEVCHPLTKSHLKYAGTDCTRCHSHKDGFGI